MRPLPIPNIRGLRMTARRLSVPDNGVARPSYRVGLYRSVPETRLFHRYILRRTTRTVCVFSTTPSAMTLQHAINAPHTLTFVAPDLSAYLARETKGEAHARVCSTVGPHSREQCTHLPPPAPAKSARPTYTGGEHSERCVTPCSDAAGTCDPRCPHLVTL